MASRLAHLVPPDAQAREPSDPMTPATRKALKVVVHVAVCAGLYLAFTIALFLGLQISPLYGNIGIAVTVALAALYVYVGFVRK